MKTKLTNAMIERARPKADPYEIGSQPGLKVRIQPSGVKTFYCQIGRGKRQRIGDVKVITLARAEYSAREILNEAHDHGNAIKRDPVKSTLGGYIEAVFGLWVRTNRRRGEKCVSDLERNFALLLPKRLTDIAGADLDRYVADRTAEGVQTATVVRDLNDLRSVFRRAISDNYLRESPFKGWEEPDVPDVGLTRYLSPKEEKRLRNALADRDDHARRQRRSANDWRGQRDIELLREWSERDFTDHLWPMVLVSLNSGLRYGELAQLEWSAVDLRARNMTITWKTAKGKKTRHIPLNREAMDVLTRWKKQNDGVGLVFKNLDGSRIKSVKTAWGAVLAEATIEDFRWHDLRHTFASNLVQRGVDLVVVRDLLGHASIAQTMRYAHLRPGQTAAAVARLAA